MNDEARILKDLSSGDFNTTTHADERMAERNVADSDIRSCGRTGTAFLQSDGKYKVTGKDLDGDSLTLICVWNGDTLIITVF